jgi:hypothetical protein
MLAHDASKRAELLSPSQRQQKFRLPDDRHRRQYSIAILLRYANRRIPAAILGFGPEEQPLYYHRPARTELDEKPNP